MVYWYQAIGVIYDKEGDNEQPDHHHRPRQPGQFCKGVKYAKEFGGKFDGASKTWTIPTHRNGVYNNACNALHLYSLIVVGGNTDTRKHDHNCPANFGGACECEG